MAEPESIFFFETPLFSASMLFLPDSEHNNNNSKLNITIVSKQDIEKYTKAYMQDYLTDNILNIIF